MNAGDCCAIEGPLQSLFVAAGSAIRLAQLGDKTPLLWQQQGRRILGLELFVPWLQSNTRVVVVLCMQWDTHAQGTRLL